jgi:hypothetical protein
MTKVTRILGLLCAHLSALTTPVEAGSAKYLIWRRDQARLTPSGGPYGECRLDAFLGTDMDAVIVSTTPHVDEGACGDGLKQGFRAIIKKSMENRMLGKLNGTKVTASL